MLELILCRDAFFDLSRELGIGELEFRRATFELVVGRPQFLGSFGAGFRVSLGYIIVLRFDFSRTTDFETISNSTDFDFFFGWNF